jgi:hypothetical protein
MLSPNRDKNFPRPCHRRIIFRSTFLIVLILSVYGSPSVLAYDCTGCPTPTFEAVRTVATLPGAHGVVSGHFNNDGKLDIAVMDTQGVRILLGDGNGNFSTTGGVLNLPGGKVSPVVGEFNGDGKLDLAFSADENYGQNAPLLYICFGDGAGGFAGAPAVYGSGLTASFFRMSVADFNKDGRGDFALQGILGGFVMLSNSLGQYEPVRPIPAPFWTSGNLCYSTDTGDFNEDGNIDIALGCASEPGSFLYLGDGQGNFVEGPEIYNGYGDDSSAVADMNGDGHLDHISDIHIQLFDGALNVTQQFIFYDNVPDTPGEWWSQPMKVADFNVDGKPDMISTWDNTLHVVLGDGSGDLGNVSSFTVPIFRYDPYAPGTYLPSRSSLTLGDVNGDGKTDVIAVDSESGAVSLLLNTTQRPAGAPVSAVTAPGSNSTVASDETSLTFSNVTATGTTTIEPDQTAAANYSLSNNLGSYEIETTAAYSTKGYYVPGTTTVADPTKGIKVSFKVPSVTTESAFNELVVTHGEDTNGDGLLEMVPYNGTADPQKVTYHDFATKTVWVYVPHLSPFVVLKGEVGQISDLVAMVKTYNLKQGIYNSFDAKLAAAQSALEAAKGKDRASACYQIAAFINEAKAQSGKALTAAQAQQLVASTNGIRLLLGCR